MATINTSPAPRELTAMEMFDRVAHRNLIAKARRAFFARGGVVRVFAPGDTLQVGSYAVGAFGKRIDKGLQALPLP